MRFSLTSDPIESLPSRAQDAAGGYVVFEGRVRNRNEGREVQSLEYEAFGELALRTGEQVLAEAREQFSILDVRCIHRTGHLQIGDIAIRVEVASAHRKAAFAACDWIVDEVKKRVPIWKKEHYAEGDSGWINCEPTPPPSESFYTRQIRLPEVGLEGQQKLAEAKVVVVGAGGLGSPALMYLAAAGVGTLGIVEFDRLDITNLHRQILYTSDDLGESKANLARRRLERLNPNVKVAVHGTRITTSTAAEILSGYDVVVDCTDNFHTKFLINDACVAVGKPLIQASIYQYEGQMLAVVPGGPCLRCLWPEVPAEGCVGSCAEAGVLGFVPGVFGALQASEGIKLILGLPSPLRQGHMMLLDLMSLRQQLIGIPKDPSCPVCGSGSRSVNPYEVEIDQVDVSSFVVVDIREEDEVALEPLRDSVLAPMSRFDVAALPAADRYLLVCATGTRSGELVAKLCERGESRFYSLIGGVGALRA